jgi:acyl-CoA synthetase (AMP-forming)/AMP-acid ligase II/alkylation response protein AidB-like acyl-CoA dehydrogenase/acyl carrier protein
MNPETAITERLRAHAESSRAIAYTFLRDDGKADTITYRALYDGARGLAAELLDRAQPGSRALLLYPSGLEFIKAYLACMYAGIVAVPSSMPRKSRPSQRLAAILQDAAPSLILTTADCIQMIRAACSADESPACEFLATDALALGPGRELPPPDADTVAFLQYTSGSTGAPNGVEVTHRNIISNVTAIEKAFGFSSRSVMVGWLPLFHDMGLIGNVLAPLHVGFPSVLMSPSHFLKNPFAWLQAISVYRGTCAGSPNFGWDYCVDRIPEERKKELDLGSLEVAYNGSEPVRAGTLERFHEAFKGSGLRKESLFPCYGMAEATLFVSGGPVDKAPAVLHVSKTALEGNQIRNAAPGSDDARPIVSCGRISEDMNVVVVDPETCLPCSQRRLGEIWIAGASVARGYWNRPEETREIFQAYLADSGKGPYMRSGDLGFIQDGELFITGRSKDLIVINGRNIYPQDIEQVIEQSIDFVEPNMCAAFSIDKDNRESLAIIAEANRSLMRAAQLEQKETGSEADRIRVKNEYLVKLQALAGDICSVISDQFDVSVSSIAFVKPGTFPRTSSGKVQRLRCKRMAMNGQLDIVYVMPDSIFDRRQSREPAALYRNVLFDRRQPRGPGAAPPAADTGKSMPAASGIDRARSRQKADAMIEWFRDYAERRLNSRLIDERRTVPPYVVLDLGNKGFFGLQAPARLGGCELSTADLLRVMEQVAGVDLTLALLVGVHNGLGMRPIQRFGDEATLQRMMPDLASGRRLAGFALTEPGAGSNPMGMQATAVKIDGGWRVNAEKQWIGIGSWAGVLTVFAKAFGPTGLPLGTVALMMSEDTPGITQGPESMTMGMRGIVQNTVYVKDAFVPDSAVLGSVGEGMNVAQDAMMFSRLGIGAMSLGAMKRCAQLMVRYATRRSVSTGLLIDNPVTLARLEELTAAIHAAEALIHATAELVDRGETVPPEAYIACKTAVPEFLGQAADDLIQLLGGRGYIETNGAAQLFRDARVLRIFEGPTETLNMHLGASVSRHGESIAGFLSGTLGAPHVAELLTQAIADLEATAARFRSTFADELAFEQWTHFQAGRLATAAMVLAAAQKSAHAAGWAMRRFVDLRHAVLGWFDNRGGTLSSPALIDIISQYTASIGDVEQQLAGEAHGLDPVLRREQGAEARVASGSHPQAAHRSDRSGEAGAPDGGLALQPPATARSQATKQMIHDSVAKWLRAEKRRTVDKLDDGVSFSSLGMDSLGAITLTLELERRIGVELSPEIIHECQTIGRLAAYIDANISFAPEAEAAQTATRQ